MNDNFIFFRYNNNFNKKDLDISPRTHISVVSRDNKYYNKNGLKEKSQNKIKKLDLLDYGIKKLITLGKQNKKYITTKESFFLEKKFYKSSNHIQNKSCKKLTPFQIYEKNKQLLVNSLRKKNAEKALNIKPNNSDEFNINYNANLKNKIKTNFYYTPSKHYHTITCNFKNKLIKSMFEKNRVKIQTINDKIEFVPEQTITSSKKYLLSCDNTVNNYSKKNKMLNDFYIGKEKGKRISLYKRKPKIKMREIFLSNNYKNMYYTNTFSKNKNNSYNNANFEDFCNNIYTQIPLIELNSIKFSNDKYDNLFINKIYNKFKKQN